MKKEKNKEIANELGIDVNEVQSALDQNIETMTDLNELATLYNKFNYGTHNKQRVVKRMSELLLPLINKANTENELLALWLPALYAGGKIKELYDEKLCKLLTLEMSTITTLECINKFFFRTTTPCHPKKFREKVAKRWNRMAAKKAEEATTIDVVKAIHEAAPNMSCSKPYKQFGKNAAGKRLGELLTPQLESAKTGEDIIAICNIFGTLMNLDSIPMSTTFEEKLMERWSDLSTLQIQNAKTIEEAKKAFEDAPGEYNSYINRIHYKAMKKWDNLVIRSVKEATTSKEMKKIYEVSRKDSDAKNYAQKKWDKLSLEKINCAITADEIKAAFESARKDSEAQQLAIKKLSEILSNGN
jgi:hypothetical protein